jgi:hypothetical protein
MVEKLSANNNRKVPPITLFTISGQAKYTGPAGLYLAKITSELPVAEGCAVVSTSARILEKMKQYFPQVRVRFNQSGIRTVMNNDAARIAAAEAMMVSKEA